MSADAVAAVQRAAAKCAAKRAAAAAAVETVALPCADVRAEREAATPAAARVVDAVAPPPPRLGGRVAVRNVDVLGAPFGPPSAWTPTDA